jgi:hypothetical protein
MLVVADSPENAFYEVANKLSDGSPQWSDWHNADYGNADTLDFAGRWSGTVFASEATPDEKVEYNHLRYSDDPALAETIITQHLAQRMASIAEYKAKAVDLSTHAYDPYAQSFNMDLWGTKKLAQLLDDEWVPDTGIYDLDQWTAGLAYFIQRVATDAEHQYLIPVDFHF